MINIAIFGPPGSGKSTQAEPLVKKFNLIYVATGGLLRKEISEKTELGLMIQDKIGNGGFASDEIMMKIIKKIINNNPKAAGFLFDGFPRTLSQAVCLERLFDDLDTSVSCLLDLQVSTEECTRRLIARATTSGRKDDNAEVIKFRMKEFAEKTAPIAGFFQQRNRRFAIEAMGSIKDTQVIIARIIDPFFSKKD